MSIAAKPSPDLLSMPNEILAEICTHAVDDEDHRRRWHHGRKSPGGKEWLRAVRLTCKQLHVPATVEFGQRFLTTIPVMAARGSLKTLVDICKHPSIGPWVSEIQLYGYRLSTRKLFLLQADLKAYFDYGELHQARRIKPQLQMLMEFLEEELELEKCVGIFKYLEDALKTIRGYGNSVILTVYTDASVKPLGHKKALEQLSEDSHAGLEAMLDAKTVQPSLHILLTAAARSGCLIDGLKILGDDSCYEKEDIYSPQLRAACKDDLLRTMTVLHVRLERNDFIRYFEDGIDIVLQRTGSLVEFHLRSENVAEPYIDGPDVELCSRAICSIRSHALRKLDLQDVVCRQRDILTLLDKNLHTLKDPRLSNVTMLGSWSVVMMWIRNYCSLKFLGVQTLVEYEEDTTGDLYLQDGNVWVDIGWDDSGELSHLDKFLQQKRQEQAELEEED